MSHLLGEGYSDRNKVQTVKGFLEEQSARTQVQEDEVAIDDGLSKEEMMKKATEPRITAKTFESKGKRIVLDPITGVDVEITDAILADYSNEKLFSRKALDPSNQNVDGPATNIPGQQDVSPRKIGPNPVEPTNILLQQFPPPLSFEGIAGIHSIISTYSLSILAGLFVLMFFSVSGRGWLYSSFLVTSFAGLGSSVYISHSLVARKLEKELEVIRLNMHKQRGELASPPTPESTEWLNALVEVIWRSLNPELFSGLIDQIEDVLQASLPTFVDAVKIADFSIGQNALRIVSMRGLPDHPEDKLFPRKDWIDLNQAPTDKGVPSDEDLDQTGSYVNLEISFAYFPPPKTLNRVTRADQKISLLVEFFLGAYDLFHLSVPIWVSVDSLVGTARVRLQVVSQVPLFRNCTVSLMGVPSVQVSAIPISKLLPNVLDLPFVSGFVSSSIAAATSIYVAPKSLTLNLFDILSGDGIKRDTAALGVLCINIKSAADLSAQDRNGFSDPYVVAAYAKYGRPSYSTRIIPRDLNPSWNETFFLLVTDVEVRAKEMLTLQLWDYDKSSADDLVGRIAVPVIDLMAQPGKQFDRVDSLLGFEDADSMSGKLSWNVTYFDKAGLNPNLETKKGVDSSLPIELQSRPELKVEDTGIDSTPPDPKYPSGILSIIVHQINNLERKDIFGSKESNTGEGEAGQDTSEVSQDSNNLPSAYCEIIVNDSMIFKTRVKQYSTNPFFEAGTETFVRDWRDTVVRVCVRDSRLREHDPILGIVNLPLSDILVNNSQITQLYSLENGVGYGRVKISTLFKSVEAKLAPKLLGWSTGTIVILDHVKVEPVTSSSFEFKEKKLLLSTSDAKQKLDGTLASRTEEGHLEWTVDESIRLPTFNRYASALYFDYGGMSIGPLGTSTEAFAALWLSELVDDEVSEIRIPIITSKSISTLRHNYIDDHLQSTHSFEVVGWLTTRVMLASGLEAGHEEYAALDQTRRHEFETFDRIEGLSTQAELNSHAGDDGVIDKDEAKAIKRAHEKSLAAQHRGPLQFQAVRTAKWSKDSLKDRMRRAKNKLIGSGQPETVVASEAAGL